MKRRDCTKNMDSFGCYVSNTKAGGASYTLVQLYGNSSLVLSPAGLSVRLLKMLSLDASMKQPAVFCRSEQVDKLNCRV